VTTAI